MSDFSTDLKRARRDLSNKGSKSQIYREIRWTFRQIPPVFYRMTGPCEREPNVDPSLPPRYGALQHFSLAGQRATSV